MSGARLLLVAAALLLAGCGDAGEVAVPTPSAAGSPTPTPTPTVSTSPDTPEQRCTHPTEGYALSYPADWFVAQGEGIEPCTFFHPEPLELEPATEADGVAVRLDVMQDAFPEARRKVEADGGQDTQETTVDGRQAVRVTGETTDLGLLPAGLATTAWVIDMGTRSLLLTTDEGGPDDYDVAVEVLDEMARSVEVAG